jgi:RNA polymerase sigma factor (sigma-70 family)
MGISIVDRSTPDDADLGFEAEFQQVQRSAFFLARRLGCSTDEALEAVQDAAERAWRYRLSRNGPFRAWFLSIVYRTATRPRLRDLLLPVAWRPALPTELASEHDPDLLAALGRLPSRQRAALWLRYCEDLSTRDVSRILRITETATKQLLLRAREALRKEIDRNE